MPENLENSSVATGLKKVSLHSNPKEGQCQGMFRLLYNCAHFTLLARQCSKSFKLGFSSTLTKNFQMLKLDLEKAKKSEIKLPTFTGSSKKLDNSRKTSISASLTTLKPLTVWNTTNCGKCLKRWEYQTTLPASGETSMQVTMQQFRTRHGTTEWFKTGKGVCQGCILPPCLFNCSAQHNMQNARLGEPQAGIKMARRNINNFRYAGNTTLMAESKEELKSFLMKVKEESEKVGL